MKEKEIKIKDLDKKIIIRELSWDEWMTLMDERFSTKMYMTLALKEPNIVNEPDFFKTLNRNQGSYLLEEIGKINKENFSDEKKIEGVSVFQNNDNKSKRIQK